MNLLSHCKAYLCLFKLEMREDLLQKVSVEPSLQDRKRYAPMWLEKGGGLAGEIGFLLSNEEGEWSRGH